MDYGICNLSVVPLRLEPTDTSEMVSQVLLGEHFKVLEIHNKWSRIQLAFDNYEGWIDNKQFLLIPEEDYTLLENKPTHIANDLINFAENQKQLLTHVLIGSHLPLYQQNNFTIGSENFYIEGEVTHEKKSKENIVLTALQFINSPYLWGGKTPLGIDCSGLTQLVYKLNGYALKRDAKDQAGQGEVLSFIEESEPGDLAFFDNEEGNIIHVGIMMADNYIIHAHGKVRIDRLDHLGIYNVDTKRHTHKLRVIKKII
ncbi:C40 family peptidase [Wenyingzhuangia sp. 2_MG-2023]|uniref:C40 family peptidase n=1 Tax=Wenyingzhuangia sp. 2_MG-2023 TaxID=3062639 RepID=UPI0026E25DE7|nr:C40 family peptidase [Wenyingzhuangia sp. 2_MG-2023]MDO6739277.1 C40 family peptidase [Wenyingzhuangia sp. 2_MG-2023]